MSQFLALYWSFSISPSNEYSELISFRIDWFDLLAVQETLKSLLHSLKHPQFRNINSLALSLLCGPTLTSIHDYWKNHIVKLMKWEMRCKFTKRYFLGLTEQKGVKL